MCIGASEGASGSSALRRASSPHRPLALVRLGAASHTSDTLYEMPLSRIEAHCLHSYLGNEGRRFLQPTRLLGVESGTQALQSPETSQAFLESFPASMLCPHPFQTRVITPDRSHHPLPRSSLCPLAFGAQDFLLSSG